MNQILSLGLPLGKRIVLSGNDGLSLQEPEAEARSPSNLSRAPLYVLALLILVALLLAPLRGVAAPDQAKGKTPWAMVLCTYPEAGVRGNWQPRDWEALFVPGTGGLTDYFREVSYGAIDVSGSRVFGWFTLPYAKTEAQRTVDDAIMTTGNTFLFSNTANFHDSDAGKLIFVEGAGLKPNTVIVSVRTSAVVELSSAAASTVSMVKAKIQKSREALIEDCAHAAESQVHFPDYYGIIAVRNDAIDADATARSPLNLNGVTKTYGKLLLADWWLNVTHIGHEMLHGYGLEHSRSDMPSKNADGTALTYTEYGDPWDIMSAMVVNGFPGTFGMSTAGDTTSGPGMNAANLDLMGWMPATKRWVWNGIPGSAMLSPLNAPEGAAPLVAIVPLGDPLHYYTVELRRADHWDQVSQQRGKTSQRYRAEC